MEPLLLGIGGSDHDFSAVLMRGRDIRVAIEQERLSRRKHSPAFWYEDPVKRSIDYCLRSEQVTIADVDTIVGADTLPARLRYDLRQRSVRLFSHHLCHAASAYMMLPVGKRAGVLVYDGYGSIRGPASNDPGRNERETFSFYLFTPNDYQLLGNTVGLAHIEQDDFQIGVTNSIGMLYELVTALLGYDAMESGKTMGLSSYGAPRYVALLEEFIEYGTQMSDCFRCKTDVAGLSHAIEDVLRAGGAGFGVRADVAASVQAVVNKTLVHCSQFFAGLEIDCLCVSGGCGLNTVANSHLVHSSSLSIPISIPPHCSDAGLAYGALWLEHHRRLQAAPELTFRGDLVAPSVARPGHSYMEDERCAAVQEFYPQLVFDAAITTPDDLANLLAEGAIIGLFNGRSEFGPRALGGRSILADPRSVLARERINRRIKSREPYRPLAPIVLSSNYDRYFVDGRCADPYMLKNAVANEHCTRVAPAIVHIDGTARVQIICERTDPLIAEILKCFERRTGVGLLINTSFNRRGEPIVESPSDAIDAFLGLGLDGLFLEDEFYRPGSRPSPSM